MRIKTLLISTCLIVSGCVPHISGSVEELAETTVKKSNEKPVVERAIKTEAELAAVTALAGKWSVVRKQGQKPCALQLKTVQFGKNYSASSVCSGKPNVWAWNTKEDALVLYDHRSEVIGSFHKNEVGSWKEAKAGGDPALRLIRHGQ
ncbi:AprI/Inh family metalloprotease inhibitor [Pseudovibrio brasiliensis]|uniref:AprI/Inh family metalloprotease inhibitor n=1 Tax=Pseudovibrio brasiliensis TaxID=1898042 RepID=A0ABX8AHY1_9HYPH|nr:AprI/Inh family metalloprotease inhibitor [Pseudovibrio brasiliensis]QUS54678.1 AprI/Inh family metalloprotease inhibitor [Pseudovibrio brasiliensis]